MGLLMTAGNGDIRKHVLSITFLISEQSQQNPEDKSVLKKPAHKQTSCRRMCALQLQSLH